MRHLLAVLFILALGCEPTEADSCSETGRLQCPGDLSAYCVPIGYDGPALDCLIDTGRTDCPPGGVVIGACTFEAGGYVPLCPDPTRMPVCE